MKQDEGMLTNALTAKAVDKIKDGKHRDGQGFQFEVKGGSRRWTFSYMFDGRQRELAIGKYPAMSLADARAKRSELREAKDRGLDPRLVLAGATVPSKAVTFRQDMSTFIAHMRGEWTAGSLKDWQQSMDRITGPLMDRATASLSQADVLEVIEPVWETTNETARRVLGRIEQVIEHAIAVDPGRFSGSNPCSNVFRFLPRVSVVVKPRPAMPWRDLASFFAALRQRRETAARALEMLLLACCPRTSEVMRATWSEIDGGRWNVPAEHMKSGVARTIPLSSWGATGRGASSPRPPLQNIPIAGSPPAVSTTLAVCGAVRWPRSRRFTRRDHGDALSRYQAFAAGSAP